GGSVKATCDASSLSGQCSVTSPTSISPATTVPLTVTLNIPNSAAPLPSNSYNINVTVTDSSGQPTHSLALPLTVIQDFTIGTVTPATQTVSAGQSATYNFSVLPAPTGGVFPDAVTLSPSMSCPGLSCSFTPSTVTPGSSAAAVLMTVTASSSASLAAPSSRRLRHVADASRIGARRKPALKPEEICVANFSVRTTLTSLGAHLLWRRRQQWRQRWEWWQRTAGDKTGDLHHHGNRHNRRAQPSSCPRNSDRTAVKESNLFSTLRNNWRRAKKTKVIATPGQHDFCFRFAYTRVLRASSFMGSTGLGAILPLGLAGRLSSVGSGVLPSPLSSAEDAIMTLRIRKT